MGMAMPIGIVGNAFSQVWEDRDRLPVMKRFRNAFLQEGLTLQTFQEIFSIFDEDGNGTLDTEEFGLMLKTMQLNMSEERVNMLYHALDTDGVGYITLQALIDNLVPKAMAREFFARSSSLNPWRFIRGLSLADYA